MKYADKRDQRNIRKLTLVFSLIVLAVLVAVLALSSLAAFILVEMGAIASEDGITTSHIILFMAITSVVLGTIISIITSKMILSPLNMMTSKINSLANGNFGTRVDFDQIVSRVPSFLELSTVFNKLSEELQSTEMLRRDFINNFSHEFKTPIVSIAGFAKLLKKGNLTEEQKEQYLTAIEEESMRLSYMATNVLNLTKVENQSILTDVSKYNVSEQIRSCILLLEPKWAKKELDFQFELDEYTIDANEELLKQVWINLIDNAIKFSNDKGAITITASEKAELLSVSITNYGFEIPPQVMTKIFNKFYQGDVSHSTEGNGIGLSIVKKIVDLHKGKIIAESNNSAVTFTVTLPKKQA
ncbi:MAG: HAMP domain-containing histidine kinase [Ruminococcaceae bacterium]|nr:HAMP domain-containing histidine kinase [Oscillospiraceae bacterium]